jgi:adenylate kinase
VRIVMLGPPGAGKGTQARRICERYDIELIGTGDIFRENVQRGTELGSLAKTFMDAGELVPDDVVVEMVAAALDGLEGFILDGFPRTTAQAEALELKLDAMGRPLSTALAFSVSDELAVKRLAGRRTCSHCGRVFNVEFDLPRVEDVCDRCGGELIHREDDEEHTVRHRIEIYHKSTEPLIEFYTSRSLLRSVDADGTEDEVTARAIAALGDLVEQR